MFNDGHRIEILRMFLPPERLPPADWADTRRQISQEVSAEPGQWRTSRAPYQRGIMNAANLLDVEVIVVMKSAQVGWTEIINNILAKIELQTFSIQRLITFPYIFI